MFWHLCPITDSKQKGDAETFLNLYLVYHGFFFYTLKVGEGRGEEKKKDQSQLRGAKVIGSASQAPAVTVEWIALNVPKGRWGYRKNSGFSVFFDQMSLNRGVN